MKKRRQHYVWRKYLEPWCIDGKVWCHRKGGIPFHTNPTNVAVERDFYQLTQLTKNDIVFIQKVAIETIKNDTLRELNAGWISTFDDVFRLNRALRETDWIPAEFIEELDRVMHNLDEDHHNGLEKVAEKYLESLHKGDASFYEDDDCAVNFIYFLASQYFRTKNIRDSVLSTFGGLSIDGVSIERTWPIMRHIFSTCVGFNLYAKRREYKLVLLNNASELEFITSDQPVLNIHAAGRSGEIIDEVEFYYPVSPSKAIIISNDKKYAEKSEDNIGPLNVSYFNDLVVKSAYEQVFTKTDECMSLDLFVGKKKPDSRTIP
jgi:hypothetical protein